jgi:hypothetical protein
VVISCVGDRCGTKDVKLVPQAASTAGAEWIDFPPSYRLVTQRTSRVFGVPVYVFVFKCKMLFLTW